MELEALVAYHVQALRGERRADATQRKYALVEHRFCAWLAARLGRAALPSDLTVSHARAFLAWLEDEHRSPRGKGTVGHGPLNIRFHAQVLKIWSRLLADEWEALFPRGDPLGKLKIPAVPKTLLEVFTRPQFDLMLRVAASGPQPRRNVAILSLLIETGIRLEELCGLTIPDVELATARRNSRARIMGKGSKERWVYFGGTAGKALMRYVQQERRHTTCPALFLSIRGKGISSGAVEGMVKRVGTQAGIRGVRLSPHTLRHSFATWYLRKYPGRLEQLRQLLGHATLQQVLTYARLAEADLSDSYGSLLDD
jgi:site-specific recombinase XerD